MFAVKSVSNNVLASRTIQDYLWDYLNISPLRDDFKKKPVNLMTSRLKVGGGQVQNILSHTSPTNAGEGLCHGDDPPEHPDLCPGGRPRGGWVGYGKRVKIVLPDDEHPATTLSNVMVCQLSSIEQIPIRSE